MIEKHLRWKNVLETLLPPTRICKLCFEDIHSYSISNFLQNNEVLCEKCRGKFKPIYEKFKVGKYPALAIYAYDENIKSLLYQFKGCFDYELYPIFFSPMAFFLKLIYANYYLVPIPSYIEDDKTRGFNHVKAMYSILDLKMVDILVKTEHVKQASQEFVKRREIHKYLKVKENISLRGKNILIVDDVYTTGSTMKAAIKLIEELHPKRIKILVMSKVIKR